MRATFSFSLAAVAVIWVASASLALRADVSLPAVFSEHMVLQRSASTPVWGKAAPGEKVAVAVSTANASVVADKDGRWRANLDLTALPAGPHELTVTGRNQLSVTDVLIGEVWLASGQSNMAWVLRNSRAEREIAESANNRLRFFNTERTAEPAGPAEDVKGKWVVSGPETAPGFSAVAYYFANRLQRTLNVPVGVLHSSWGGTGIDSWTSLEAARRDPEIGRQAVAGLEENDTFKTKREAWRDAMKAWTVLHRREDTATPPDQAEAFAKGPAGAGVEGWSTVKIPGTVPGGRIVWLRREVTLPARAAGQSLTADFDEIVGMETIYWDGRRIGGRSVDTFGGEGMRRRDVLRRYSIPASLATEGRHVLAIRLYLPVGDGGLPKGKMTVGSQSLDGEWLLKTERVFDPLPASAVAEAPAVLRAPPRQWNVPTALFNGMIHPLIPYGLRGVIWYQGESDSDAPTQYRRAFPLMITDWRARWGRGDLPFYWCQLPNIREKTADAGAGSNWAVTREAQSLALKLPNTAQAVLIDLGEAGDIHPPEKREVGARLAAIALARDYGIKQEYSGPVFESMTKEGSSLRLRFTHLGGGLKARPLPADYVYVSSPKRVTKPLIRNSPAGELEGFAIRGEKGKWQWAEAKIEGDTVVVSAAGLNEPVAVRYGWANNPTCNLYNEAGFPAAPFRSDAE